MNTANIIKLLFEDTVYNNYQRIEEQISKDIIFGPQLKKIYVEKIKEFMKKNNSHS